MNRRKFLQKIGLGAAVVVATPVVASKLVEEPISENGVSGPYIFRDEDGYKKVVISDGTELYYTDWEMLNEPIFFEDGKFTTGDYDVKQFLAQHPGHYLWYEKCEQEVREKFHDTLEKKHLFRL